MKRTKNLGPLARGRRARLGRTVDPTVESHRSPFERLCLLKWSFVDQDRAVTCARKYEKVVHCRWCGNWHLVGKK